MNLRTLLGRTRDPQERPGRGPSTERSVVSRLIAARQGQQGNDRRCYLVLGKRLRPKVTLRGRASVAQKTRHGGEVAHATFSTSANVRGLVRRASRRRARSPMASDSQRAPLRRRGHDLHERGFSSAGCWPPRGEARPRHRHLFERRVPQMTDREAPPFFFYTFEWEDDRARRDGKYGMPDINREHEAAIVRRWQVARGGASK